MTALSPTRDCCLGFWGHHAGATQRREPRSGLSHPRCPHQSTSLPCTPRSPGFATSARQVPPCAGPQGSAWSRAQGCQARPGGEKPLFSEHTCPAIHTSPCHPHRGPAGKCEHPNTQVRKREAQRVRGRVQGLEPSEHGEGLRIQDDQPDGLSVRVCPKEGTPKAALEGFVGKKATPNGGPRPSPWPWRHLLPSHRHPRTQQSCQTRQVSPGASTAVKGNFR